MNSQFKNPHGLTEPGQFSTARDLSILARKIYQYPFIRECMRTRKYTFVYNDGRTKLIQSTNKILKRWESRAWIKRLYRGVEVCDCEALQGLS